MLFADVRHRRHQLGVPLNHAARRRAIGQHVATRCDCWSPPAAQANALDRWSLHKAAMLPRLSLCRSIDVAAGAVTADGGKAAAPAGAPEIKRGESKMSETIHIHPSVDQGVKAGSGEFRRRHAGVQMRAVTGEGRDHGRRGLRPRLRLHQVLEAGGRDLLRRRRRAARQPERDGKRRQARHRGPERGDPALRLQGLRRSHVRPDREHQASVLRLRLRPSRIVPGSRAGRRRHSPRSSRR